MLCIAQVPLQRQLLLPLRLTLLLLRLRGPRAVSPGQERVRCCQTGKAVLCKQLPCSH